MLNLSNTAGVLNSEDESFVSPKNFSLGEVNPSYNALQQEISNYEFENFEGQGCNSTMGVSAEDLDRCDLPTVKVLLLNFFKFCLSKAATYELNSNFLKESECQLQTAIGGDGDSSEAIGFLNFSNCKLAAVPVLPDMGSLQTLILSYN